MKTEIAEVAPCKKRITVEAGVDEVKEEFDKIFADVSKSVALPGFRVGRVPRALLEKRFGDTVGDEVKQKLVAKAFDDVVKEHKLSILGDPKMDKIEFEKDKPLKFEATFEVKPEFELPDYAGIELVDDSTPVSDKDVDEALHGMRLRASDIEAVEGGALQKDDLAIARAELFVEGKSVWKEENLETFVGGEAIAGMKVGDVEKLLSGKKAGDEVEAKVEFHGGFMVEGKPADKGVMKLGILDVKRPRLPALDDEFAKRLGMQSVGMLREEVKKGIERDSRQRMKERLEGEIMDKLAGAVAMQMPLDTLKLETERIYHQKRMLLTRSGVSKEALAERDKEIREEADKESGRRLKALLILEKIADKEKIAVSDAELDARVNILSRIHRLPPKELRTRLENEGSLATIRGEMRDRKVLDFLYEKADIKKAGAAAKAEEAAPKEEPEKPEKAEKKAKKAKKKDK